MPMKKTGISILKTYNRSEKKLSTLDKYCIFSFACLLVFTVAMLIVQTVTGVMQDTLITCFFGAFGGELLLCAMIKRLKLKNARPEE